MPAVKSHLHLPFSDIPARARIFSLKPSITMDYLLIDKNRLPYMRMVNPLYGNISTSVLELDDGTVFAVTRKETVSDNGGIFFDLITSTPKTPVSLTDLRDRICDALNIYEDQIQG